MPMRLGRLGLRSAARMAPAAFWASWAKAFPMISERLPEVAKRVTVELTNSKNLHGCVRELAVASEQLDRHSFVDQPCWKDLQCEFGHPLLFQWSQESGNTAGNNPNRAPRSHSGPSARNV